MPIWLNNRLFWMPLSATITSNPTTIHPCFYCFRLIPPRSLRRFWATKKPKPTATKPLSPTRRRIAAVLLAGDARVRGPGRDLPADRFANPARDPFADRLRLRARRVRCGAPPRPLLPRALGVDDRRNGRAGRARLRAVHDVHGGSGITIIALGGLVYPILREEGYPEGFSLGLVTAAGSLGLLFPPSLPVILYSVVANVPADQLYLAGLVPGLVLVLLVAAYGMWAGRRAGAATKPFSWREVASATWEAKWELMLPVLVIGLFASGLASLVEASAAAAAFAIATQCFVTRDIHPVRDLPRVLLKGGVLVGAVLILLASAMGLTSYLVDVQLPSRLLAFVQAHVHSQLLFLLVLNLLLLVLGSVLEIYSAIVVLAPPWCRSASPSASTPSTWGHLPREPRARLPVSPGGPEPLPLVLPVRQTDHLSVPLRRPVPRDQRGRRPADHVCAGALRRRPKVVRQAISAADSGPSASLRSPVQILT